jgi:hypothetical protein
VGVDGRACLLCDLKRTTCKGMAVRWEMSSAMAMSISMVMMVATVMRLWGFKTWLCGGQRSDQNPVRLEDSLRAEFPKSSFTARREREGRMFFISVSTARPCRLGGARSVRLHVGARGWKTASGR